VYGPWDNLDKFIPKLLRDMIVGKSEILLTTGVQRRDIIYVSDVIGAYKQFLGAFIGKKGFFEVGVGTGRSISIKDFVLAARYATGSGSNLRFGSVPQISGEIMDSKADISFLNSIGWKPIVKLEEGLDLTISWLKSIKT
jgi:nucleoside-diphosphate-sugar epimerase